MTPGKDSVVLVYYVNDNLRFKIPISISKFLSIYNVF